MAWALWIDRSCCAKRDARCNHWRHCIYIRCRKIILAFEIVFIKFLEIVFMAVRGQSVSIMNTREK